MGLDGQCPVNLQAWPSQWTQSGTHGMCGGVPPGHARQGGGRRIGVGEEGKVQPRTSWVGRGGCGPVLQGKRGHGLALNHLCWGKGYDPALWGEGGVVWSRLGHTEGRGYGPFAIWLWPAAWVLSFWQVGEGGSINCYCSSTAKIPHVWGALQAGFQSGLWAGG